MTEEEQFNSWFAASKYCQVIAPSENTRRIAYDAWSAAMEYKAANQSAPAGKDGE